MTYIIESVRVTYIIESVLMTYILVNVCVCGLYKSVSMVRISDSVVLPVQFLIFPSEVTYFVVEFLKVYIRKQFNLDVVYNLQFSLCFGLIHSVSFDFYMSPEYWPDSFGAHKAIVIPRYSEEPNKRGIADIILVKPFKEFVAIGPTGIVDIQKPTDEQ